MTDVPIQIGPYLVEREIGRGGMGVVYLARDERLDRLVAIKALPAELSTDPARLERFEREGRALAQLNHPNVAGIYGVEEQDGQRFLILEFVEGDTLGDRLEAGPIPVAESLELAAGIAAGLDAAHEVGVIHRDLKPDNIKITPDGKIKVLDFGLAKASGSTSATSSADSPTLTNPRSPTIPGAILGTAAYMSPEQARGRAVDKRADIWSFGVILYEMLTGVGPFDGETASDSIGAVMHKRIELDALPPHTPPMVRHVIRRCLERDRDKRFRDIGDVHLELEASTDPVEGLAAAAPIGRRATGPAIALVGLGLVIGGIVAMFATRFALLRDPDASRVERFEIPLDRVPASRAAALAPVVTIAPDGSAVAYESRGRLWVRPIDSFTPMVIEQSEGGVAPFWSPDAQWIGFARGLELWRASASGTRAQRIGPIPEEMNSVNNFSWCADGQIYFTTNRGSISQIPAAGGAWIEVLAPPAGVNDFHSIEVLPGDAALLVTVHFASDLRRHRLGIWDGSDLRVFEDLGAPGAHVGDAVYSPTGHLVYEQGGDNAGIWAVPFSASTLQLTGAPFLVAPGAGSPSVDGHGTLVYTRQGATRSLQLMWVDIETAEMSPLHEEETASLSFPAISRDGSRVAYVSPSPTRRGVWVEHLETGDRRRVNSGNVVNLWPSWSPDGATIAAVEHDAGRPDEHRIVFYAANGSGQVGRPIEDADNPGFDASWTTMVFQRAQAATDLDIFSVTLGGSGTPAPIITDPGAQYDARLSPDGDWLAYTSEESSHGPKVYVTRFPSGEGRWLVFDGMGERPQWSSDGRQLYFLSTQAQLHVVDVDRDEAITFGRVRPMKLQQGREALNPYRGYAFDPNSARVLMPRRGREAMDLPSIAVVKNWVQEFTGQ